MKTLAVTGVICFLSSLRVLAAVPVYGQCGGLNYTGDTTCASGSTCIYQNDWYYQCLPGTGSSTTTTKAATTASTTTTKATTTAQATSTVVPSGIIGYAASCSTTGGAGGTTTRVSTLADLTSAVTGDSPKVVILTASLTGNTVIRIGSNTSLYGANGSVTLTGVGLRVIDVSNVIIRNIKIQKVLASAGDAIGIQASSKVWVDHVDLSSDRDHDKDYYDGLLDITHGCTCITVTWSYLHDHWKSSLVGHSDSNGSEDTAIRVTYAFNRWSTLNSRLPSFRFGVGHIYNNYYQNSNDGINTRVGAQLLVENNVFESVSDPLYSTDEGYACARGNDFGGGENTAPAGTCFTPPYSYSLLPTSSVKDSVINGAGAKLTF